MFMRYEVDIIYHIIWFKETLFISYNFHKHLIVLQLHLMRQLYRFHVNEENPLKWYFHDFVILYARYNRLHFKEYEHLVRIVV